MRFVLVLITLGLSACASQTILRDRDYRPSTEAYQRVDPDEALRSFPQGEINGFITSVEKGWLSQWAKIWDPGPMQKQVDTFDQRRYVSIRREAGTFLFQESEEGYVPSEHEIILLHLVSALHFKEKNLPEEAKVELRRAGYVLDRFWDDPALRLWLGALWTSLGEWSEAQVDFRRANELSPNRTLRELAERPVAPSALHLHFYGNGPRVEWTEGNYQPRFLHDPARPGAGPMAFETFAWFKRHTLRNTELRELLLKSNFMAQYLGSKSLTYAEHGLVKTTAATVSVLGVAVGVAIIGGGLYLLAKSGTTGNGSEPIQLIATLGLGVGGGLWAAGRDLDRDLTRGIREHDRSNQEDLRIYRMVRFLPTWISLTTEDEPEIANTSNLELGRGVRMINHY